MAIGSGFAAANTMYAAVARRSREIGTLRVLGFSKGSILASFLGESLLLSVLGGVLGCLLVLPLNGLTTGMMNFVTFSEVAFNFQITPAIMLTGVLFAMILGAIGGLVRVHKMTKVKESEVIVRLEDDEYRAQLQQARGQLTNLEAKLRELQNGSRPEEIAGAQANLNVAKADLENARINLARIKELTEAKVVARQQLDDAQARY